MIAALPMYDWPELRDATDAWWAGLARALRAAGVRDVPDRLSRGEPAGFWNDPRLLFGQTCGLPLVRHHADRLRVLATPCYGVPGCAGPTYSSLILVRADSPFQRPEDLEGEVAAYSEPTSLSGHLALRLVFAAYARGGRFFGRALATGSHAASMTAVHEGRADVCAVDCVSFAIAAHHRPALTSDLRHIASSPPAPALPWVTSAIRTPDQTDRLRAGLRAALADPALDEARAALFITGAELLPEDAYAGRVASLEATAAACVLD
ncbi:MAG TPA: PhnD/SsuA/transferrin family substrate-binding protein [Geminicoccaceae bacterium]|nr:PhnD/SsuA/transferrin family substrate-binding protein [Geminicoccaceae bacterium]